jgi:hypothetical protein
VRRFRLGNAVRSKDRAPNDLGDVAPRAVFA